MSGRPGHLALGLTIAAIVVGLAAVDTLAGGLRSSRDLVATLTAAAALLLAILAARRGAWVAWPLIVLAALVGAGVPIELARAAPADVLGSPDWLPVAIGSSAGATLAVATTALYATRPSAGPPRWLVVVAVAVVAWLAIACVLVIAAVLGGVDADPAFTWLDLATLPVSIHVHLVLLLGAVGLGQDVRDAARRADRRRLADRATGFATTGERVRATLRELIPGEPEALRADVEAERIRLAGDLHASVLPRLRAAIAEAEGGGAPATLAARLRDVDDELERVMHERWPVVLESFGLVVALEELAEQAETDRSAAPADGARPTVLLDVEAADGRAPRPVERAAFRIAQVALDNALRHAAAGEVRLAVAVSPARLGLTVADDGRGLATSTDEDGPSTGRGLADLQVQAAAVGGSVVVEAEPGGGMRVRFAWPAPAPGDPGRGPAVR